MNSLVTVIILGYNSKKYLKWCFDSIFAQSYSNLEIIYIDNASADGSLEFVEQNYCSRIIKTREHENIKTIKIIKNLKNLGYAGGNNIGIQKSFGEYVLCLNPDIILDQNYIKNIIESFLKNSKIGAITGKLLKFKINENSEIEKTNIIDSCGLQIFKSHQVVEWGGEEIDSEKYNKSQQIFGVSGAAPIFKKSALETIRMPSYNKFANNSYYYFDEDFFAYKEDVDLSFRLLHSGFEIWFEPRALAYHHRWETGSKKDENQFEIIKKRKDKSGLVNYLSYRNHLYFLIKNEFFINFILYLPWIFFYELKKLLFALFYEKNTLKGLINFIKNLPLTCEKRRGILNKSKIRAKDIRKWVESDK